jgi:ABC-type multidrug transport system ATPase subunit
MLVLGQDMSKHSEEIQATHWRCAAVHLDPKTSKSKRIVPLFSSFYKKSIDMREITQLLGLENMQNVYVKSLSGGWKATCFVGASGTALERAYKVALTPQTAKKTLAWSASLL